VEKSDKIFVAGHRGLVGSALVRKLRQEGFGNLIIRDFSETDARVHFILTPRTKIGILRLGVQTERYSFSYSSTGPLPKDLHSTALVIGLDTEFSESFLIRLEADPGFYGTDFDDFGRDTFNVPVILGGTYIFSSNFQVVLGVGIDAFRKYPVLPGGANLRRSATRRRIGMEAVVRDQTLGRGRIHSVSEFRFPSHPGSLSPGRRRALRDGGTPYRFLAAPHRVP